VSLWPVVSARRAASAIDPLSLHDALPIFRASGTNADVISDILADLPIVRQKESGGPAWHRYDEVVRFDPDLIVMHYSTFRGSDADDPRPGLKTFLRYFADRPTRFLIYTRSSEAAVRHAVDSLMADVDAQHPGLLARIAEPRIRGQGRAIRVDRIRRAAQVFERDPQIEGRRGVLRALPQRRPVMALGFLDEPLLVQQPAEVDVRVRVMSVELEGAPV